ncbi:MAG TPA: tRNA uridine-5-carboxymethylaminomethyl(34) synthesis GTPase MnmE, partial [Candidatus Omnitrophota bacterium]|nr:tRNA uridine-5-carboxymethylaminomethyl(34) synthesis GTPase MnmE [Candidatus Omnitrophota bacterium]
MSAKDPKDTITAISTPMGKGGIGIIRLSGNKAFSIADAIFVPGKKNKPSECPTHTVHHGYIIDPNGDIIDEVLLTVMKAPSTYTTEDMVEINCHGGAMPLKGVLELCLKKGARLAEPGEFTKRAFMKGRIDLAQAEAVLDIINSESEASRKMAVQHFRGIISREIDLMREKIVEVLSQIELTLDFSEEDVHFASVEKISKEVKTLRDTVKIVLDTAGKGMVLREGAEVVICGKPNVGKSSLMNA